MRWISIPAVMVAVMAGGCMMPAEPEGQMLPRQMWVMAPPRTDAAADTVGWEGDRTATTREIASGPPAGPAAGRPADAADTVDEGGGMVLALFGALGGGPLALGARAIWRKVRPARAIVDLVTGAQDVKHIVKRVAPEALVEVTSALKAAQSAATEKLVATAKRTLRKRGKITSTARVHQGKDS